jgi:S1-C subfamily serine protease
MVGIRSYSAIPVEIDPRLDLAVLRTFAPLGPPLSLASEVAVRGTKGAVVGYPENGPLHASAAAVSATFSAIGRDIYGSGLVTRQVYELSATVLPGNSGGPLVGMDGSVLGVVFSRSTVTAGVGYALTSVAVASTVRAGEASSSPVSTGSCPPG